MALIVTPSFNSPVVIGTPQTDHVTASGGVAPYSYAITSGSLPIGMSLNGGTGAITGTPTTDGDYTVTIQATDSSGPPPDTGEITFTIRIVGAQRPVGISSWLPKGIDEPCLLGGRRFLTSQWDIGHLTGWTNTVDDGTINTPFYPNGIQHYPYTVVEWNLLSSIQGQRNIETYETLFISIDHLGDLGHDETDMTIMIDPGNGLPIYIGGPNGAPMFNFYGAVPFMSNSNLIKIAFQISSGGFFALPADLGMLTLAVANWKVKPFSIFTFGVI